MANDLLSIGALILGIWVAIEAIALTVLPRFGLHAGDVWVSPENVFTLFSDYFLGGWLLYSTFAPVARLATCLLLGALALTHLFRCAQVILGLPRPFCSTKVMMLINLGKLSLALSLWGVCVAGS